MICPIMTSTIKTDLGAYHYMYADCEKEKCEWWSEGNCIVHGFKRLLKDLNSEIYKGWSSICDRIQSRRQF